MSRARVARRAAAVAVLALASCSAPPDGPRPADAGPVAADRATAEAVIEAHNRRVESLRRVTSSGVLEYRWVDDEGVEHKELQINTQLWLDLPWRTGLHATKLGREVFWIGSNDDRYWLFSFLEGDSTLYVGEHDERQPPEGWSFPVRPLALVDLFGLTAVPPVDAGTRVIVDESRDRWIIEARGSGGPLRLDVDRGSGKPLGVELLSPGGEVFLSSVLGRYDTIMPVDAPLSFAAMPTLVDISDPEQTIAIKLGLDVPKPETPPERLFDLDRLIRHLRPDQRVPEAAATARGVR